MEVEGEDALSEREKRVMKALVRGDAIKDIAKHMYLSPSTISTYRARILKKLECKSNADLVRYAIKQEQREPA